MPVWRVEYLEAFRIWVDHARPTVDEESEMLAWLLHCETDGPPTPTGNYGSENMTCVGPGDRQIVYRSWPLPGGDPAGDMLVILIGPRR